MESSIRDISLDRYDLMLRIDNLSLLSIQINHIIFAHRSLGYIEEGQQEVINIAIRLMNPTMVNNDPAIHSGCLGGILDSILHFFHIEPIPHDFSGMEEDHHHY